MKKPKRISVPMSEEVYSVVCWFAELENRTPANFIGNIIDEKFRDSLNPTDPILVHHTEKTV